MTQTPFFFLSRLTQQELAALSLSVDPAVASVRTLMMAAERLYTDSPEFKAGIQAFVTAGVITAERAVELLK